MFGIVIRLVSSFYLTFSISVVFGFDSEEEEEERCEQEFYHSGMIESESDGMKTGTAQRLFVGFPTRMASLVGLPIEASFPTSDKTSPCCTCAMC